jgi:hypothetical protein
MAKKLPKKPAKGMVRIRLWATEEVRYHRVVDVTGEEFEEIRDYGNAIDLAEEIGERYMRRDIDVDGGGWIDADYEEI